MITGSNVKVDKEQLNEIFKKIDENCDGIVDMDEYKKALKTNPMLIEWTELLNKGFQDGQKVKKDIKNIKVNTVMDIKKL